MHTSRCILRPWRPDDAKALPTIANTREISWNTSFNFPYPFKEEQARRFLTYHMEGLGEQKWAFAVKSDGHLIGGCGAQRGKDVQSHTAEIGYWLGVAFWGQGLASEAVNAMVNYLATSTDIEQLTAHCYAWNPASFRVLEKAGFQQEGCRRGVVRKWGKQTDLLIFGKLLV